MFAPSLRGSWSTWTSAAGKTYAVDWDNIFKTFGNNVTSDPNWIIKAIDAHFAYGGPRVQVNPIPASPAQQPVQQPSEQITTVIGPTQIHYGTPITINPTPTSGPTRVQQQNIQPLQPINIPENWVVYSNPPAQPANPQGVPMSQFDFSTLPKMRAHAQLGRLGDPSGCSIFNPASWPTCSTWIIQARTELANMHNALIDLTNAWDAGINDIQSWPDSLEKSDQLAAAQQGRADAYALVQQHSGMQGDFESKVQPFVNIGLGGLWKSSGGTAGLGILPFGVWALIATASLGIAALTAWQIVNAQAVKAGYEQNTAFYNMQAQYNQECAQLLVAGQSCSSLTKPSGGPASTLPANFMMIAGLVVFGIFLVGINRR